MAFKDIIGPGNAFCRSGKIAAVTGLSVRDTGLVRPEGEYSLSEMAIIIRPGKPVFRAIGKIILPRLFAFPDEEAGRYAGRRQVLRAGQAEPLTMVE